MFITIWSHYSKWCHVGFSQKVNFNFFILKTHNVWILNPIFIEYGGEAGTIQELTDDLEKRLLAKRDFFIEDDKFGVDEKKRVTKTKYDEYIFGLEGSFRQLSFD